MQKAISLTIIFLLVLSVTAVMATVQIGRDAGDALNTKGIALASETEEERDVRTHPSEYTKENHTLAALSSSSPPVKYTNLTYRYNNQDKNSPKEAILHINGTYNDTITIPPGYIPWDEPEVVTLKAIVNITVDRPDDRPVTLLEKKVNNKDTFGVDEPLKIPSIHHGKAKKNLSEFGHQFYESENVTSLENLRPAKVLFGKANDNILSDDPDELKGGYIFKVSIEGASVDLEFGENETSMTYVREVSSGGNGIVSSYWWLIPIGVIGVVVLAIIALIVSRKNRPPEIPEKKKQW